MLITAPTETWPLSFAEGISIASLIPATSGQIVAFVASGVGGGGWRRIVRHRAMRWVVADD